MTSSAIDRDIPEEEAGIGPATEETPKTRGVAQGEIASAEPAVGAFYLPNEARKSKTLRCRELLVRS